MLDEKTKETVEYNKLWSNWENSTDSIICPYCEDKWDIEYENTYVGEHSVDEYEEGEEIIKCPTCGETFKLSKETEFVYITQVM